MVGHYADGARLIGLTEKQIYRELKRLKEYSNLTTDEQNSPYAQPLHLALLKTPNKRKKIRRPKRQNSARSFNSNNSQKSPQLSPRAQEAAAAAVGRSLPNEAGRITTHKVTYTSNTDSEMQLGGNTNPVPPPTLHRHGKIRLKIKSTPSKMLAGDNRRMSLASKLNMRDGTFSLKNRGLFWRQRSLFF